MRSWHKINQTLLPVMLAVMVVCSFSGCSILRRNGLKNDSSLLGLKKNKKKIKDDLSGEYLDPLGARDSGRILWDDLSPSQIGTTLKTRWLSDRDPNAASAELSNGQQTYAFAIAQREANPTGEEHRETFAEAANQFRVAAANAPETTIEEEALYLEGESYFFADRYVQANRAFEKLIAKYPGTKYLDRAEHKRLAIAQHWLDMKDSAPAVSFTDPQRPRTGMSGEARRILHRIRVDDPTGKYADDATMALGNAFLRDNNFYEAADSFQDLRQNYPNSKYQFNAHMLELQARLSGYQGSSYDATPLVEADKLLNQIVRRFPKESQEQLESLEQQATRIRTQLAERDYSLGDFYAKRGQNRAAKISYEQVAQNYSDTQYGKTVAERIADVSSKPPVPGQHAEWLVNLFPDSKAVRPVIASRPDNTKLR